MTVAGTGSVQSAPDVAHMTVQVLGRGTSIPKAVDRTAAGVRRVRSIFTSAGVPAGDVRLVDIGVNRTGRGDFLGAKDVTVTVRDVAAAKGLAASLKSSVADLETRLRDFSYRVEDPERFASEARAAAVADARAAAESRTTAAGRRLGAVLSVREMSGPDVSFRWVGGPGDGEPTANSGYGEVPEPPSRMTVSMRVAIVWEVLSLLGTPSSAPGVVTVTGLGRSSTEPEYVRTLFLLRGWGTDKAAARKNAAPTIRRLRDSLEAAGVAAADIRAEARPLRDEYSHKYKTSGWAAIYEVEVKVRDLARAEQIVDDAAHAVGSKGHYFRWQYGASGQAALRATAVRRAKAGAAAAAGQYADLVGRPLGKVVAEGPPPRSRDGFAVVRLPEDDAPAAVHRVVVTRELG